MQVNTSSRPATVQLGQYNLLKPKSPITQTVFPAVAIEFAGVDWFSKKKARTLAISGGILSLAIGIGAFLITGDAKQAAIAATVFGVVTHGVLPVATHWGAYKLGKKKERKKIEKALASVDGLSQLFIQQLGKALKRGDFTVKEVETEQYLISQDTGNLPLPDEFFFSSLQSMLIQVLKYHPKAEGIKSIKIKRLNDNEFSLLIDKN